MTDEHEQMGGHEPSTEPSTDREQNQGRQPMLMPVPMTMPEPAHIAARHDNILNDNDDDGTNNANTTPSIPTSLRSGAQQQQSAIASYPPGARPPTVFSPAPPPPYMPYVPPAPMPRRTSHSRTQSQAQPKPHLGMQPSRRPSGSSGPDRRTSDGEVDSAIEDAYKEDEMRMKGNGLSDGPHIVDCCAW